MKKVGITGAQIKKIHALKGALCLDDAVYRELLFNTFRAGSCKDLNYYQAERLIQDMEAKAVASGVWEQRSEPKKFEEWGKRSGCMATPAQIRKIESTWSEITRAPDPESSKKALRAFLERTAKVSDLRFLDFESASKAINGLVSIRRRQGESASPGKEGLSQL